MRSSGFSGSLRATEDILVGDEVTWLSGSGSTPQDLYIWRVRRKLELLGVEHIELANKSTGELKILSTRALIETYLARLIDIAGDEPFIMRERKGTRPGS